MNAHIDIAVSNKSVRN